MKTTFDACDIWIICWSLFGIIGFILTRLPGIFKQRGDGGHPARISWQNAVSAHVAGGAVNVVLSLQCLHTAHLFLFSQYTRNARLL